MGGLRRMKKEGGRSEGWRDENRRYSLALRLHDARQVHYTAVNGDCTI